jgi:phage gpG-like protein
MLRFDKVVSVKWEIRPSVGIVAKDVERLGLDIRSFREPLTRIVKNVMIPSIKKNFAQGGRPPWEPLAEATIKARHFSAWPILEVSGTLKRRATQLGIWDIGLTTATVRALPGDAFYGVFHQAGAGSAGAFAGASGLLQRELSAGRKFKDIKHASPELRKMIGNFIPHAQKELGKGASNESVVKRALGMLLDAGTSGWNLPARPFIMYQESDIPKMEAIFGVWMTERAIKVGRFHPE